MIHTPVQSLLACLVLSLGLTSPVAAIDLTLRYQVETAPDSGRYHRLERSESWEPARTAVIVCDVWDYHHSWNAVQRLEQIAPRLNAVLKNARQRGMTIIHSPSDCMDAYDDHPARKRALNVPQAANLPLDIATWCSRIPAEEQAVYPIDQSDGGDDDEPEAHARWAAHLESLGRNPALPWKRQSDLIEIDADQDFISDRGGEVWSILEQRGITHVILTGVHTNMCVLGRPFGLRNMARSGRQVVLMRDMTDTMYNPRQWPYVSHFTGTDLVVSHIEKFVCPTITSDQFLGGKPLRLKRDRRPHVVMLIAEDEYNTERTLPEFALRHLGRDFRVSFVFGSAKQRNDIPGMQDIGSADVLLVSVRRRLLPPDDLAIVRDFVDAGKPVIGIRTASHAFSMLNSKTATGRVDWPEFDAEVFGGNYSGHHGNALKSQLSTNPAARDHQILKGISPDPFAQSGSLYKTSPLAAGTTVLMTGRIDGVVPEPVAWTFRRADGGKSFYTSLGHPGDFQNPNFVRLLRNALAWATDISVEADIKLDVADYRRHWAIMPVPASWSEGSRGLLAKQHGVGWYRSVIRLPQRWTGAPDQSKLTLSVPGQTTQTVKAWMNGTLLVPIESAQGVRYSLPAETLVIDDANLLVLRLTTHSAKGGLLEAPVLRSQNAERLTLSGRWQFRLGTNEDWSNMPLPAKFGGGTDYYFEPSAPGATGAREPAKTEAPR